MARRAWVCLHPDHQKSEHLTPRTFLLLGEPDRVPRCPVHGAMTKQPNVKYGKGKR